MLKTVNELQEAESRITKPAGKERVPTKVINFRLSLTELQEVKKELEEGTFEGCNTPSAFIRRCIELRHLNAVERTKTIQKAVENLLSLKPSQAELLKAGLDLKTLKVR